MNLLKNRFWIMTVLILGILVILAYILMTSDGNNPPSSGQIKVGTTPTLNPAIRFVQQVERDTIPAIDNPQFLTAEEAQNEYTPQELVIGVEINGDARAYSIPVLSRHEIVNDVVGGEPIAITWCPLCFNAIVFNREIDGQTLDFGVSGLLVDNLLVMYDRQTDSLWTPLDGTALQGSLMGKRLEMVQSWFTTWEAWLEHNPTTLALAKNGINTDVYASYYNNDDSGVSQNFDFDERLPTKSFVIGVEIDGESVAYPFTTLRQRGVVNDIVGEAPITVVFIAESQIGLTYSASIEAQTLTFSFDPSTNTLIDDQTGTIWDAWQGLGIEGELEGQILRRIPSPRMFWFAWRDHHPKTHIFQ